MMMMMEAESASKALLFKLRKKVMENVLWGKPQLVLGCRWYALLLTRTVNTQLALCGALDITGRRLVAMAGRLVVEVG
jgi:hypothetical protein